jgi:RNA polymerase sigma factor (sigma-70 family)
MAASERLVLSGDEGDLFARYQWQLQGRVARWVNTTPATVEDACSFAWLQLMRRQPRRETALGWLTTVAIHEAIRLDQLGRRVEQLEAIAEPAAADEREQQLAAQEALEAMATLPAHQGDVVALHAGGFTYDEIAKLLGRTFTHVNKHLVRGRAAMRRRCSLWERP